MENHVGSGLRELDMVTGQGAFSGMCGVDRRAWSVGVQGGTLYPPRSTRTITKVWKRNSILSIRKITFPNNLKLECYRQTKRETRWTE